MEAMKASVELSKREVARVHHILLEEREEKAIYIRYGLCYTDMTADDVSIELGHCCRPVY
jgi:hypothetical protein